MVGATSSPAMIDQAHMHEGGDRCCFTRWDNLYPFAVRMTLRVFDGVFCRHVFINSRVRMGSDGLDRERNRAHNLSNG